MSYLFIDLFFFHSGEKQQMKVTVWSLSDIFMFFFAYTFPYTLYSLNNK